MVRLTKNEHIDIFFIYGLSVCFVVFLSLTQMVILYNQKSIASSEPSKEQRVGIFDTSVFSDLAIEGKAYVVYDLVTYRVIASHNENEKLPLASLTKMMTAITAMLHQSKDDTVIITPKIIEDGYDLGLHNNQEWKLSELLKYTLLFSSNDGAEAVASTFGGKKIFVEQMNNDAKALGFNFQFTDPAGLDVGNVVGGTGSALDVARMFGLARSIFPEILDATTKKRQTVKASNGKIVGIPNTNQDIENFPGAEASKTGFTDLAGGNLAIIVDVGIGHPVVFVVLGSTREGRFRDVEHLYKTLIKSMLKSN